MQAHIDQQQLYISGLQESLNALQLSVSTIDVDKDMKSFAEVRVCVVCVCDCMLSVCVWCLCDCVLSVCLW